MWRSASFVCVEWIIALYCHRYVVLVVHLAARSWALSDGFVVFIKQPVSCVELGSRYSLAGVVYCVGPVVVLWPTHNWLLVFGVARSVVVLFPICYWRISLLHRPAACLYYSFTYPIQKNDSDSMTSYQICYLENWKTDYGTRTGLGSGTGSSAGYRSRSEGSGFGSLGGYGSETGGSRNGSTAYGSRSAAGGYGFITG